jgi:hypothetical protein
MDEWIDLALQKHFILDPCAWWDEKHDMTYPHALFNYWVNYNKITTLDIRWDSGAKIKENYLLWKSPIKFDIIITNPPFNIAQQIIEKAINECIEWGYVIMLLRLNYIWSKARQMFWTKYPPYAIYAHNKRIGFTDDWKTDSIEYAHFVWKKWMSPAYAKFKILFS